MDDKNTYYDCKCKYYEDHVITCETCKNWMDKVDKAIETHKVDEYVAVTNSKRWKNSKLKKKSNCYQYRN